MGMLIRAGQTAEVEQGSQRAIAMLEALPPGRELALAYRVRASLPGRVQVFRRHGDAVYFGAYDRKETLIGPGKLNRLDGVLDSSAEACRSEADCDSADG